MNLKKYISELKRRRVIKASLAYLIVAWVIAEVASVVLPTFNAPAYFMKTLLLILIIGFPINLVFAWIYDLTPEGIKKTEDIDQKTPKSKLTNSRLNKVIIASLSIVVVLLLFKIFWDLPGNKKGETESSEIIESVDNDEKSIAVLPFKNWSGDSDLEPFCDGMTDAVITRLSKIRSLGKVISRTSVMKYKGTDKSATEIAKELGVTHILEGSFQKSGNQVKINLQLIDGKSDNHYWSDEYSGEWNNDTFKIQAEVAKNVAMNMDAQITDIEIKSIRKIPTNNDEAYNLFLKAEFQRNKQSESAFENAIPLYKQAIALDSSFIEAYVGLATIWQTGGLVWGIYNEQEAWKNSKKLLQKALEIDSTNIQIKDELYLGCFYYDWNFTLVEKYFQLKLTEAITKNWGLVDTDYLIKTGRYNEALLQIDKRILFDPSYSVYYMFKAEIFMFLGKENKAVDLLKTNDQLYSDDYWYLRGSAKLYYYLEEYEKSRNQLNKFMANFPEEKSPIILWLNAVYHHMDGDNKEVEKYLGKLNERYNDSASGSPAWFIALYYCTLEDYENAFIWLQKSYDRHEVEMTWFREEPLLIPIRDDPRYKKLYLKIGFPKRS